MDFTLTEEQTALSGLARQILTDTCAPDRLRDLEAAADPFAADAWRELAKADLLGLCLPEAVGGGGYSILEAALVAREVGRAVAPVPYLATVVLGALPVAEFGTAAQQAALLGPVVAGDGFLAAALVEDGDGYPPAVPATTATTAGTSWRLDGAKAFVVGAHLAGHLLVPATTDASSGASTVFVVPVDTPGVSVSLERSTNLEPLGMVTLDGVALDGDAVLGAVGQGAEIVAWTTDRGIAAICAMQAGVCEEALAITARYTSERQQFNAPIATFQAVAQRAANAYIDTEGVGLTAISAAWQLAEGLPADEALAIAKLWSAEGAQRVVHAAQHLHGGIGVDTDYPVHRYFRWAKHLELLLGGGTRHLLRLGGLLADGAS